MESLGRYRLIKLLATGGMGEVFVARQEGPAGFTKTVVIKRILRHLAGDQNFIDLFLNEARLAAQLQHPHIAQVFGLENEGNTWFIAMEYVHGRSLRDVLRAAREQRLLVPPRIAARLAAQALQGLDFAHELTDERGQSLGILHRDVSPENLLVSFSGSVKLVDFGIAKAMTGAATRVGRPKGKLA
jgi:serine/threonine-protein kinase